MLASRRQKTAGSAAIVVIVLAMSQAPKSVLTTAAVVFEMLVVLGVAVYFLQNGISANPSLSVLLALAGGTAVAVLVAISLQRGMGRRS